MRRFSGMAMMDMMMCMCSMRSFVMQNNGSSLIIS